MNKKISENYVKCGWRKAWIMFDLENGHARHKNDPGKGYIWIFESRSKALKHRKQQHKNPRHVRLSYPVKVEGDRRIY